MTNQSLRDGGLKPYSLYKESGLPWLGEVPAHWPVVPHRALFSEVKDRNHTNEDLLSVTITKGIVRQNTLLESTSRKDSSNQDKTAYKLVQPRDIAYNKMRAWQGAIGASTLRGVVSPAYVVMRLRNDEASPEYYHHLFRTPRFTKEAERWSYGITSDMWSLRPEHFKMIYSPFPPAAEQAAIVRYLGWANGRIERVIRAKRKVIALLGEQKQTIIHRAVTRGLDHAVSLKDSGLDWLPQIPEHWGIVRNLALFSHRVEPGRTGLPVLQVSLRSGITPEELDQFGRPKRYIADVSKYKFVHRSDMAYNTMRMWQGAVGVAPSDGLVSPAYVVLQPRQNTLPEFYEFVFRTSVYKQEVNRKSTGIVSDRNRLYWDSFKEMPNISLPRDEQSAIVNFIRSETKGIDDAVSRLQREIILLREFGTRLVSDVVTGKLDVRDPATHLPHEESVFRIDDELDATDTSDLEDGELEE